jgi:hypothetical protein
MKIFLGLALLAILMAAGASQFGFANGIFPQNWDQRAALNRCEEGSPNFNRLSAASRDECLRATLAGVTQNSLPPNTAQPSNQVDLREAAGRVRR